MIIRVNCVLAGAIFTQGGERREGTREREGGGGGGGGADGDRQRGADVSVSPAPCPTCIFKEQLCFLLLLLLHANYRKRRWVTHRKCRHWRPVRDNKARGAVARGDHGRNGSFSLFHTGNL